MLSMLSGKSMLVIKSWSGSFHETTNQKEKRNGGEVTGAVSFDCGR